MNYSDYPYQCRLDIFKPSGKWHMTTVIELDDGLYHEPIIQNAVIKGIEKAMGVGYIETHPGWSAVCLEPYHENTHPIMIKFEERRLDRGEKDL